MDRKIKLFKYRTAGVREYWIVDPAEKAVEVHLFTEEEVREYTFQETVPVGIYEDFAIDFGAFKNFSIFLDRCFCKCYSIENLIY